MTSQEKDRAYLEAGIPEVENYLLSEELYWPITARGFDLPRLTIGGLLLAKKRLEARKERFGSLLAQLEAVRSKWRTAWETKARREVGSRLGLWSNYLADYRQNPEAHADTYPHEVSLRVMLELLLDELPSSLSERESLSQLDNVLRANFLSGDFIWEADLQAGFPREEYWFLFGRLKS
jgi:hypothetical protein